MKLNGREKQRRQRTKQQQTPDIPLHPEVSTNQTQKAALKDWGVSSEVICCRVSPKQKGAVVRLIKQENDEQFALLRRVCVFVSLLLLFDICGCDSNRFLGFWWILISLKGLGIVCCAYFLSG